ncbi:Guanine nucleotide-binding protein alpha-2 subunit [Mycena sanguinolenta]|uniref:Guanine nucleotide-binding protein alpha-2 subunit n=1 Tax=Mycena sanguinolenta TaxID=230812 RepID=A0A8H7DDI9_9AGAR|nr:Guanine nucleotide-binding protein alpha-2 subunit [Mycena sanguinolenta]
MPHNDSCRRSDTINQRDINPISELTRILAAPTAASRFALRFALPASADWPSWVHDWASSPDAGEYHRIDQSSTPTYGTGASSAPTSVRIQFSAPTSTSDDLATPSFLSFLVAVAPTLNFWCQSRHRAISVSFLASSSTEAHMGGCVSSPSGPVGEVTELDKLRHRQAEKELKELKAKMAVQVKVLLLGSGRLWQIHHPQTNASHPPCPLHPTRDRYLLDALPDMELELPEIYTDIYEGGEAEASGKDGYVAKRGMRGAGTEEGTRPDGIATDLALIEHAEDIGDGEPFPMRYYGPLSRLWAEPVVQTAWNRGNEAAVPENLHYFFSDLPRLFDVGYVPTEQDIVRARARTIGITETSFHLRDQEMMMVDVGGQKSERRKWIHCFQDVTSILFLVSLSGYDQCLVEDRDANQMQDAMTIWDSICHSQWFKQTSIILFLNKNDLFQQKIRTSDIKSFFPDFDGEPHSVTAGHAYFKKRFGRLAVKAGRAKEREIYIHITTATDTELLRVVMAAVEVSVHILFAPPLFFLPRCADFSPPALDFEANSRL